MTADILITKLRAGGNQMIRADSKGKTTSGTWINISAEGGVDGAIALAEQRAAEHKAIAAELKKVRAEGVDW